MVNRNLSTDNSWPWVSCSDFTTKRQVERSRSQVERSRNLIGIYPKYKVFGHISPPFSLTGYIILLSGMVKTDISGTIRTDTNKPK